MSPTALLAEKLATTYARSQKGIHQKPPSLDLAGMISNKHMIPITINGNPTMDIIDAQYIPNFNPSSGGTKPTIIQRIEIMIRVVLNI